VPARHFDVQSAQAADIAGRDREASCDDPLHYLSADKIYGYSFSVEFSSEKLNLCGSYTSTCVVMRQMMQPAPTKAPFKELCRRKKLYSLPGKKYVPWSNLSTGVTSLVIVQKHHEHIECLVARARTTQIETFYVRIFSSPQ